MTTITVIGKPDCHLCEVADEVIAAVLADLPEDVADRVAVEKLSITDNPELHEQWWEKIPVVLIDGHFHAQWRVRPDRLRAALTELNQGAPA